MTAPPQLSPSNRIQAALREPQTIILRQYPDATFRLEHGRDEPEAIHLVATVEAVDHGDLPESVLDRMMELQIDELLPIFVVPVRSRAQAATSSEVAAETVKEGSCPHRSNS